MGARKKATDRPEAERNLQQAAAMNQELLLSAVRQHELIEAEERLNAQLRLEMAQRRLAVDAQQEADKKYRSLFDNMLDGYAHCRMIFDEKGRPDDFIYLDTNNSFESLTGLKDVVGKKVTEVIPGVKKLSPEIFELYGRVALTGVPETVELYFEPLGLWLSIKVYSTKKGDFVAVFDNITERKRAEEDLRERETRFRTLANAITQLCWMANSDGWIFWYNKRWYEYTGTTPEQMEGWGWQSVHNPETLPKVLEKWNASIATGNPFDMVFPLRGADGVFRPFLTRIIPVRDQNGKVVRWVGTNTDITEQKREESVSQARLRLSLTADDMPLDEILQMALDEIEALTQSKIGFYHFLEADQETLSLQHWSTNTLANMCTAEGKGSHYPVSMAGVWADCLREQRPVIHNDYASLPNRKDLPPGHAPVIREMVVPIRRGARTVAIIGVGNKPADYNEADIELASLLGDYSWEIVERKRAEEALSSSELRYRRLFESAGDGILLLDADNGTVYDVNPFLMEMLGYSHEEMVGKELWDIGPVKDIETAKDAFKGLMKEERSRHENLPLKTSNGHIIEVEVISSVYMVNQTKVIQCRVRDITERKALERLKADFYAMVSHDMRSPLTVIWGYAKLLDLKSDMFDAETNEMVSAIIKSGEKIEGLIENFLSFSKMEAGKIVVNPVRTDIVALLRDVCLEIEMAVQEKKLDLKTSIADDMPKAMVDPKLIQRAVMNLLHNAVNYTPAPGTITLEAASEGSDYIMISVADTGSGIPAGEQKSIFDKYYRSDRTAGVKGSGLGLAIVKGAAEAHGGRVEVESEVGKGSTFRLFIPVNL